MFPHECKKKQMKNVFLDCVVLFLAIMLLCLSVLFLAGIFVINEVMTKEVSRIANLSICSYDGSLNSQSQALAV